jgi:hypothetical protein
MILVLIKDDDITAWWSNPDVLKDANVPRNVQNSLPYLPLIPTILSLHRDNERQNHRMSSMAHPWKDSKYG